MQRVKRATAVVALPAAPAGGVPGYFAAPNPQGGVPATVPGYEWYNGMQEEVMAVVEGQGIVPSANDNTQLRQAIQAMVASPPFPFGLKIGLSISNSLANPNTQIDIAPGVARSAANNFNMVLPNIWTKTLQSAGAWAAGTNQSGLFSGVRAANTWYHVFLIRKTTTGEIDAGFDTSITAANIPAGYSAYRRIGSIKTDVSNGILGFIQLGNEFFWKASVLDLNLSTSSTIAALLTASVPPGLKVKIRNISHITTFGAGSLIFRFSDPDGPDLLATYNNTQLQSTGFASTPGEPCVTTFECFTNSSGQIRYVCNQAYTGITFYITTTGWTDYL